MKGSSAIVLLLTLLFTACKKDNRALVVGKIHKASKLATTEFTIDKIVHGTKKKKLGWFIKLNEARFIAYSQAKVKAGVEDYPTNEKKNGNRLERPLVSFSSFILRSKQDQLK